MGGSMEMEDVSMDGSMKLDDKWNGGCVEGWNGWNGGGCEDGMELVEQWRWNEFPLLPSNVLPLPH